MLRQAEINEILCLCYSWRPEADVGLEAREVHYPLRSGSANHIEA